MKKEKKETLSLKSKFKFWLILSLITLAIVIALIVLSFVYIADLGLLTCLFVGLGMAVLIALTVLTVLSGLRAYRE